MKKFTKLALAASVALSANAMAMQAMDDSTLSATTGQDGISIGIGISKITIDKIFIHDNDGLGVKGTPPVAADPNSNPPVIAELASPDWNGASGAGAICIKGNGVADKEITDPNDSNKTITVKNEVATKGIFIGANYDNNNAYLLESRNLADLTIDSDAGNGNPFINIAAKVSGLDIRIGEIGVVASGNVPAADALNIRRGGTGKENAILSGLSLKTGQITANIQLGAAPQGAMIKLDTKMIGGLEILDLGILDNSTKNKPIGLDGATPIVATAAGEIFIESIKISDANSRDLVLKQNVSVYGTNGLAETSGKSKGYIEILSTSGEHDMYIKGIHLGSYDRTLAANAKQGTSIGDVEIQGMQTYYGSPKIPGGGDYTAGAKITIAGH